MSSRLNVPKTIIISTPPQEERTDDPFAIRCAKHFEVVRTNAESGLQEIHQTRIKVLRKELDYLKETNWKYGSTDHFIGQSCNIN